MAEDAIELLRDLQSYFSHLNHLKIEGAPEVNLLAEAKPQGGRPSRSPSPRRSPQGRGPQGRAPRPRPSFAQGGDGEETSAPKQGSRPQGPNSRSPRSSGPTWGPGASSATLAPPQDPRAILEGLKAETKLPGGEAHLIPHGAPGTLIVLEAVAMEGARRGREAPYSGRIGQMLEQLLKRVMGAAPGEVCLIQALEVKDPEAIDASRGQLEALAQGAGATRILGFGAYTEGLLIPKGGLRGEGQGRFGRMGGAQVLITHGLEEMNAQPALKRPAYQDLLEFQRRIERGQ